MKKALVTFAVLGTVALAGCKKDWICECTYAGVTTQAEIMDATKKEAKEGCAKHENNLKNFDPNASCTLKSK